MLGDGVPFAAVPVGHELAALDEDVAVDVDRSEWGFLQGDDLARGPEARVNVVGHIVERQIERVVGKMAEKRAAE